MGKAVMRSGERAGKRTSFKQAGAHESERDAKRVSNLRKSSRGS